MRQHALRPLTIRECSNGTALHESTVSRAIVGRYVRTPRGTLPLRTFLLQESAPTAAERPPALAIQAIIRRPIETETPASHF